MSQENDYIPEKDVVEEETKEETTSEDEGINWKERALKAEEAIVKAKKHKKEEKKFNEDKPVEKKEVSSLNHLDTIALVKADVHTDDIKEVIDYAKYKGISIQEALKSNVIKSMLDDNAEKRKSAEVANSGSAKKSSSKLSDEALIEKANSGKLPESDADLIRLIKARKGIK